MLTLDQIRKLDPNLADVPDKELLMIVERSTGSKYRIGCLARKRGSKIPLVTSSKHEMPSIMPAMTSFEKPSIATPRSLIKHLTDTSPKRCVIYCRVSSWEQVANTSLEHQGKICRDFAARNGWVLATEPFIEEGESAKTADRTQLSKPSTFAQIRKIKSIFFWFIR